MVTLGPEVEEGSELTALVIASQHVDCIFKFDLDGQDESEDFDGEAAPVDIVSQEDVLGCFEGTPSVVVNNLDEVVELPVDVSHDGYGILNFHDVGLLLWV